MSNKSIKRMDGRRINELRNVKITTGFVRTADGSCLIEMGGTRIICTATIESGVPKWRKDSGLGWVTAEYGMLPASTGQRKRRPGIKNDGRSVEIQRLIGRSLRAVVDFEMLGENSILIDCDVIQADGGTRTASITGAYVAMCDAVRAAIKEGHIKRSPIREAVAAVSVGRVKGRTITDLNYPEDSAAEVDMNVVMTGSGGFVEVQGTAETDPFSPEQFDELMALAKNTIFMLPKILPCGLIGNAIAETRSSASQKL